MPRKLLLCLAAAAALSACKGEDTPAPAPATDAAATTTTPTAHSFSPEINAGDFAEMVKTLASDEFEGRSPGSKGEELTVNYIRDQMQRIGLQPGNGDSWFQDVPMTETTADASTVLKITQGGKTTELKFGTDMVVGTRTGQAEVKVDASDLVFVGYGVDAPEQKWNDYAGQDWKGKTVVMFVNDPGFHVDDAKLFDGKRMTYYGRWTYKFEEAARKGAAAALIVHDTAGASYGWDVVKNSWAGPQYDLPAKDDPDARIPVQGWLSADAAKALFAGAGLDLAQAYKDASKRGFKPVSLKATAAVDLKSQIAQKQSRNVVGVLPGSKRADEAVLYMAHWDHLGKHEGETGDNIYNGAVDNATGVAGVMEIARLFAEGPRPERSTVFVSWAAEETGLLGAEYYAANPVWPLETTVANINMDSLLPGTEIDPNIVVIGAGKNDLDDRLAVLAAREGRRLIPDPAPHAGAFYRSDHFPLARKGVPALFAAAGFTGHNEASRDYVANRYHQPTDEWTPEWKMDAAAADVQLLYEVGRDLANSRDWPAWKPGDEFEGARNASASARQ